MLLFVMDAQLDAPCGLVGRAFAVKPRDGIFHVPAVGEDVIDAGTREGGPQFLFRLIGDAVVITVEEPKEVGMEGAIAGEVLAKNEGFKEPGGVGEMPLCRARLR